MNNKVSDQTLERSPQRPTALKKRHVHHWAVALLSVVILALLCTVGETYMWQHRKVNQLTQSLTTIQTELRKANGQIDVLKKTMTSLESQLASEKQLTSTNESSSADTAGTTTASYQDPNFVAISPNSGYGAQPGTVTFTWAPQKYATYYVLELKYYGQTDYLTPSQDQYVRFSSTQNQPNPITLNYSFNTSTPVNYVWRVTAYATINGVDTALQSTTENNLSIL